MTFEFFINLTQESFEYYLRDSGRHLTASEHEIISAINALALELD